MTTQPLDLEPRRARAADAKSAVDQIRHAGPADLAAHGLKAALSAADVPGLIAEVEQVRRERDTLREVARGNRRHVATLSVLLERVEKLTVSTDGDDLDADAAVPVGEIRRAIQEPIKVAGEVAGR